MKWTTDRVQDEFGVDLITAMDTLSRTAISITSCDPEHIDAEIRRHVAELIAERSTEDEVA